MSATTNQTDLVAGLRALADFIEAHPDMPAPAGPQINVVSLHFGDGAGVAEAAKVAALMGTCEKAVDDTLGMFTLTKRFGPVALRYLARRDSVCERREVTKTVVEWVCPESLLAIAADQAARSLADL